MAYPSKFKELERKEGKPLGRILVERLNRVGNIAQLAVDINMGYDSVFRKVKALRIEADPPHWRLPEDQEANDASS